MFKIAVNTWAFREEKIEEFVPVLSNMGFNYLDISSIPEICPHVLPEYSNYKLSRIKEMCETSGMNICALHTGNNFAILESEKWQGEIDWIRRYIDICSFLGVGLLILHEGELDDQDSKEMASERVVKAFQICAEYAQQSNINLAWENHSVFSTNADTMHKIVDLVNCSNFGVNYDSGNFAIMGEDPIYAAKELKEHIFHAHIKDVIKIQDKLEYTGIGEGFIDIKEILECLQNNTKDLFLTIEYEGKKNAEQGVRDSLLNLKKILSDLE